MSDQTKSQEPHDSAPTPERQAEVRVAHAKYIADGLAVRVVTW